MSRIALCLSGKIGNIKGKSGYYKSNPEVLLKGYEHYKRHIIDKNNVDVFIHCWDTDLKQETLKLKHYFKVSAKYNQNQLIEILKKIIMITKEKINIYIKSYYKEDIHIEELFEKKKSCCFKN